MRFHEHRHFSPAFLTRAPGNRCLYCGAKLVLSMGGRWGFLRTKPYKQHLGYVHDYNCRDYPKDAEGIRRWS